MRRTTMTDARKAALDAAVSFSFGKSVSHSAVIETARVFLEFLEPAPAEPAPVVDVEPAPVLAPPAKRVTKRR